MFYKGKFTTMPGPRVSYRRNSGPSLAPPRSPPPTERDLRRQRRDDLIRKIEDAQKDLANRRLARESRQRPWQQVKQVTKVEEQTRVPMIPTERPARYATRSEVMAQPQPCETAPQPLKFLRSRRRGLLKEFAPTVESANRKTSVSSAERVSAARACTPAPRRQMASASTTSSLPFDDYDGDDDDAATAETSRSDDSLDAVDVWIDLARNLPRVSKTPSRDFPVIVKRRDRDLRSILKTARTEPSSRSLYCAKYGTAKRVGFGGDQVRMFSRYRYAYNVETEIDVDSLDVHHQHPRKFDTFGNIWIVRHWHPIGIWGDWHPSIDEEYGIYNVYTCDARGHEFFGEYLFHPDGYNIGSLAPIDAWGSGLTKIGANGGDLARWRAENGHLDHTG